MIPETIQTIRELQKKENLGELACCIILLINSINEMKEVVREK